MDNREAGGWVASGSKTLRESIDQNGGIPILSFQWSLLAPNLLNEAFVASNGHDCQWL